MTTLTQARAEVTQAVARLRATGCKVSTILGHNSNAGDYQYVVRLPEGIHPAIVGRRFATFVPTGGIVVLGRSGDHIGVTCPGSFDWSTPGKSMRRNFLRDQALRIAAMLSEVARRVEAFDKSGSASCQHYIDTGYYLTTEDLGLGISSTFTVDSDQPVKED